MRFHFHAPPVHTGKAVLLSLRRRARTTKAADRTIRAAVLTMRRAQVAEFGRYQELAGEEPDTIIEY